MKKLLYFLALPLALATGLCSCSKSDANANLFDYRLTADVENISAATTGATQTVNIASNGIWTVISDAQWCVLDKTLGTKDDSFTVTVLPNDGFIPREANIRISVGSDAVVVNIPVSQSSDNYQLPDAMTFGMGKETQNIYIEAADGASWQIALADEGFGTDWFTVAPASGDKAAIVKLTAATNQTGDERKVKLSITGAITKQIEITQGGGLEQPEVTVTDGAMALTLTWAPVNGARAYQVMAYDASEQVVATSAEIPASPTDITYDVSNLPQFQGGGAIWSDAAFSGVVTFKVRVLTSDPDTFVDSNPTSQMHSHFDISSGDGSTAATPFVLTKPRHLNNMRQLRMGHFYRQDADIDLSGYANFAPIGTSNAPDIAFQSSFDGNGKNISNLKVNSPTQYTGLFGDISGTAAFSNITVVNPVVSCTNTTTNAAAALTGRFQGVSMTNCHTKGGSVTGASSNVGGLVGALASGAYLDHCSNEGTNVSVTAVGAQTVGGLVGYFNSPSGSIKYSFNTANVTGYNNVGGIAGGLGQTNSSIEYCYNTGTIYNQIVAANNPGINATDVTAGGITARLNSGTANILFCYNAGEVKGAYIVGGITGKFVSVASSIANCYNTGTITLVEINAETSAGGICGTLAATATSTGIINNCYNVGTIAASSVNNHMGAIAGWQDATSPNTAIPATTNVTNVFFLNTLATPNAIGQVPNTPAGAPQTAAALKTQATYSAWDSFTTNWEWPDAPDAGQEHTGYPVLQLTINN